MQKETKEILCATSISFLAGVVITLIIFGCATHTARFHHKDRTNYPYSQQINQFKHHNKLMGRKMEPVLVIPNQNENTPKTTP